MPRYVFQIFCGANKLNTCWRFRLPIKETRISKIGKFSQSKRYKNILLEIKDAKHYSMDLWPSLHPNSIILQILKLTLMLWTCKSCWKNPYQIPKKFQKSLKLNSPFQALSRRFLDSNTLLGHSGTYCNQDRKSVV